MKLTKEIIKEMVEQVLNEEQESMLLESPDTDKEILEESETLEESDVIEVEAPNSVIEAMMKASQHPGKKIKFVRGKK